ncbi:unnamed protein product [Orchesella dallaii]|uniref:Uncharacterized protein n=1 Tax=Orchesella dallaii TaxID=48710 RepID=A0ABP1RJ15_9HEXA
MEEVLNQEDFYLLSPISLGETIFRSRGRNQGKQLPKKFANFCMSILLRMNLMVFGSYTTTLINITQGKRLYIMAPKTYQNSLTSSVTDVHFFGKYEEQIFSKFAIICEGDCENKWNVALIGQTRFYRVVPKQRPFLRSFEFWTLVHPNFATFSFSKFFGAFVQSGLYQRTLSRSTMVLQRKYMQSLQLFDMEKGNFFSYVFLSDRRDGIFKEEITPCKLSAFTGTFIISQSLFIPSFRNSTIEFVWDEGNILTTTLFLQCIFLQCILLNFNFAKLVFQISNSFGSLQENVAKELVYEHILETNGGTIANQKYSSRNLLLISDSAFPPEKWGHFILQTRIPSKRLRTRAIKLPNVIILPYNKIISHSHLANSKIENLFSPSLLIFVDLPTNSIRIGCFTCNGTAMIQHNWYESSVALTFEILRSNATSSFQTLLKTWRQLHYHLNIGVKNKSQNCPSLLFPNIEPKSKEICEIYEAYFQQVNCFNFEKCEAYHMTTLRLRPFKLETKYRFQQQIFPFIHNQQDFSFQLLVPKYHMFDSNLTAFFTPFDLSIWICTLIAILILSKLLIHTEKSTSRFNGITEHEPENLPEFMEDVLNQEDFYLLSPISLGETIYRVRGRTGWKHLPKQLADFYMRILIRSNFMLVGFHAKTLTNVTQGKPLDIMAPKTYHDNLTSRVTDVHFFGKYEENIFSKFAIICEGDCESKWNVALSGQTRFHRVVPNQKPFLSSFEFWTLVNPNFATFSFSKFFGAFVHSGLYERAIYRSFMALQQKYMRRLHLFGLEGGNLFSYVFLSDRRDRIFKEEITPCKLSAFIGTFIVVGFLLGLGVIMMVAELGFRCFPP